MKHLLCTQRGFFGICVGCGVFIDKKWLICYNKNANGNPTSYLGTSATWEKGRQLKTLGTNTYWYNKDGIRTKKAYDGKTHTYTLDGTNIIKEKVTGSNPYTAEYFYDLDGTACGLKYGGNAYYFYKNLQGDVIAITDNAGTVISRYTYDAWGKVLSVTDANGNAITSATHVANINPFRYRSYYYDAETKLYYLQSRYYDPEFGRFLGIDSTGTLTNSKDLLASNLYCYCENNPINSKDDSGDILIAKIAEMILYALVEMLVQLLSDFAVFLCRKLLLGKNEYFEPDPKDYIMAAISGALEAINPFSKGKRAKQIYELICPIVKVIADHALGYILGKEIRLGAFGQDLFFALIKGISNFLLDGKVLKEIEKLKKSIAKKHYLLELKN